MATAYDNLVSAHNILHEALETIMRLTVQPGAFDKVREIAALALREANTVSQQANGKS